MEFKLSMDFQQYIIQLAIVTIIVSLVVKLLNFMLATLIKKASFLSDKKYDTFASVFSTVSKFIGLVIVALVALNPFINVSKLLAGAGVLGVMLAFGAQSLIKDILTGFFFVFEKQLHKGDFITVNNKYTGTVEEVGFRALKIREWGGSVLSISNGNIVEILNGNVDRRRIVEHLVISYEHNPTEIKDKLDELCEYMTEIHVSSLLRDEGDNFIESFKVRGLQDLSKEHRGYKFTIIAVVKDDDYFNVMYSVRNHLANFMYENKLKFGEERVKIVNNNI